jgi:hypothetical protein
VIVAFAAAYAGVVRVLASGRVRAALLIAGAMAMAFAGWLLAGIALSPG